MFHELQIVIRRESREQLLDDARAINDFLDRRNASRQATPLDMVAAAERLLKSGDSAYAG